MKEQPFIINDETRKKLQSLVRLKFNFKIDYIHTHQYPRFNYIHLYIHVLQYGVLPYNVTSNII